MSALPATALAQAEEEAEAAGMAAPAQDPVEGARQAFLAGVELAQAGRWAEAEAEFRGALALHPAPGIHINLASALVEQGRYREAHGSLRSAESDPDLPPNMGPAIEALRERIQREAGRLAISRSGELAGAEVALDRSPVEEAWLAGDIPVTPGPHEVTALRAGEELASVSVEATAGERTAVVLGGVSERVVETETDETPLHVGIAVGVGVVLVAAVVIVGAAAGGGGGAQPVSGNFNPGLIAW